MSETWILLGIAFKLPFQEMEWLFSSLMSLS